jgi:uncharacterized membrane protein
MPTLTVLKFDTVAAANTTIELLDHLRTRQLIAIEDAATIFWPVDLDAANPYRIHHVAGPGKFMAVFWHLLFGFLFFPWPRARADSPTALGGAFSEFGLDRTFVTRTREWIKPGASALFMFSHRPVTDCLTAALQNAELPCDLMLTHLPVEKAERLREVFTTPAMDSPPAGARTGDTRLHQEFLNVPQHDRWNSPAADR